MIINRTKSTVWPTFLPPKLGNINMNKVCHSKNTLLVRSVSEGHRKITYKYFFISDPELVRLNV